MRSFVAQLHVSKLGIDFFAPVRKSMVALMISYMVGF